MTDAERRVLMTDRMTRVEAERLAREIADDHGDVQPIIESLTRSFAKAIIATHNAAVEAAAAILEQCSRDDDESETGEAAQGAFNDDAGAPDMNERLRRRDAVIADGIRALKVES